MQGWIKLYRELLDKPIWLLSTSNQRSVLVTILLLANHSKKKWEWQGKPFEVQPGQFITSLASLASKSGKGITPEMVRKAITRFETAGFLTNQGTKTGRLITVANWGFYQGDDVKRPKEDQSENKARTSNKNDKNEEKKDMSAKPTIDYRKIIDYLNLQSGHKYRVTDKTRSLIHGRLAEGFTEHDFGLVIHYKSLEWKDNQEMSRYLRPNTLFAPSHFDDYLNEAREAATKKRRASTPEQPSLTPEDGAARNADYMAELAAKYEREDEISEQ